MSLNPREQSRTATAGRLNQQISSVKFENQSAGVRLITSCSVALVSKSSKHLTPNTAGIRLQTLKWPNLTDRRVFVLRELHVRVATLLRNSLTFWRRFEAVCHLYCSDARLRNASSCHLKQMLGVHMRCDKGAYLTLPETPTQNYLRTCEKNHPSGCKRDVQLRWTGPTRNRVIKINSVKRNSQASFNWFQVCCCPVTPRHPPTRVSVWLHMF